MKYIFTCLIVLSLYSCTSFIPVEIEQGKALGVMPIQYGRISYQGVHRIEASKEEIFRQIRRWVAFHTSRTIYTSTSTILKVPTPAAAFNVGDNLLGDVIGSGVIDPIQIKPNSTISYPSVHYSVSVEANQGYYRLTLTNFYTFGFPAPHYLDFRDKTVGYKRNREFYARVDKEIAQLFTELETFVANESVKYSIK